MNPLEMNLTRRKEFEISFMKNVYTWMSLGLAITGLSAWFIASSGLYRLAFGGPGIVLALATFFLAWTLPGMIQRLEATAATLLFALFAALEGALLSGIFIIFTKSSIVSAFFVTAGTFITMSIYGQITKKDLSGLGSFLVMGLIGIIIASIVNIFVASSGFSLLINYAAVLVFTLLAAFQTQQLKQMASQMQQTDSMTFFRVSLIAAFSLYLTFLNLFIRILFILGGRRD